MAMPYEVNSPFIQSIPLSRGLKRYLFKWFDRMVACNGNTFAVSAIKDLKVVLMDYRSDPNRLKKVDQHLSKAPIRKNRRLAQLFRYMDTDPRAVLSFLGFYIAREPEPDLETNQEDFHKILESLDDIDHPPEYFVHWVSSLIMDMSIAEKRETYSSAKQDPNHIWHRAAIHHTVDEWCSYWNTWRGRILGQWSKVLRQDLSLEEVAKVDVPTPSIYSDFDQGSSDQFRDDADMFLEYFLDDDVERVPLHILDWLLMAQEPQRVFNSFELDDIVDWRDPDGWDVGKIHYIPKGGTTDLRPIAVPNRFLQVGLRPAQKALYSILKALPRDHTFNQGKTIPYIQNRLDRGHYVASIDLSKATEYLPKSIGDFFLTCISQGKKIPDDLSISFDLFDFMSRAPWGNGSRKSSWKRGQPLGTLPSFGMLALTHNLLLESLALASGYLHSPYVVLGDDVLVFSKRMRRRYINEFHKMGMEISLHKSFEHNLVEFAGYVLVKGQQPGYVPDPKPIGWHNLFDYQRNTGYRIAWSELPRSIKTQLTKKGQQAALGGEEFYRLCSELYALAYGVTPQDYMEKSMVLLDFFVSTENDDQVVPDHQETSGWAVLHLFGEERLVHTGIARARERPSWFQKKFRPLTTDAIVARATKAVALSTAL